MICKSLRETVGEVWIYGKEKTREISTEFRIALIAFATFADALAWYSLYVNSRHLDHLHSSDRFMSLMFFVVDLLTAAVIVTVVAMGIFSRHTHQPLSIESVPESSLSLDMNHHTILALVV